MGIWQIVFENGDRLEYQLIKKGSVINFTEKMLHNRDFHSASDYYATLFHELVHSTGHTSRLNREGISEAKRSDKIRYSKEELIAEMGASFLCAFTGINNPDLTKNSAAYLQNWLQIFKQDKTMVVKAASQAQKAVYFMLGIQFNEL